MEYGDTLNKFFSLKIPFIHVWGIGGIILLYLYKNNNATNLILLSIIAGILIATLECIVGNISLNLNGYRTWNYDDGICPMCNGYVSVDITLCWIMCAYIFFKICEILSV
jgi:uncharacterized membrane protein